SRPYFSRTFKKNCPAREFPRRAVCWPRLERSNVFRLEAFGPLGDVELDRLAFLQAAKAACLDSRKMHENVVARLAADEAEAFGVVKPLHCSLFHCVTCFYCFEFLLRRIAAGDMGIAGWRNRPSTAGESNLADNHWMCHPRERFNSMADRQNEYAGRDVFLTILTAVPS